MALKLMHLQTVRGKTVALNADQIESVETEDQDHTLITMKSGALHSVKTNVATVIKNWMASQGSTLAG